MPSSRVYGQPSSSAAVWFSFTSMPTWSSPLQTSVAPLLVGQVCGYCSFVVIVAVWIISGYGCFSSNTHVIVKVVPVLSACFLPSLDVKPWIVKTALSLYLHSTFLWYADIFPTWLEIRGGGCKIMNKSILKHCLIQLKTKISWAVTCVRPSRRVWLQSAHLSRAFPWSYISLLRHLGSRRLLYIRTPNTGSVGFLILPLKTTFLFCKRLCSQELFLKVELILGLDFVFTLYWWPY